MDWLQDRWDGMRNRLGLDDDLEMEEEERSLLEQWNEATTLTRTQRLLGFVVCFGMGMLLSLLAPAYIMRPVKLATTLTLGNMLSIGSMMFLVGPTKQCQTMFDEKRRLSTIAYVTSLFLTLFVAFAIRSMILALLCIICQYVALGWYSLSYIPYGQYTVLRFLGRVDATNSLGI